jgi:hypothetical protein
MHPIILHHYAQSPYSEKIRLGLGPLALGDDPADHAEA